MLLLLVGAHIGTVEGNLRVEGERPERILALGRNDGRAVGESEVVDHLEHVVAARLDVRRAHADHVLAFYHRRITVNVGQLEEDLSHADHLLDPVAVVGLVGPPELWQSVADRVEADFVSLSGQPVDLGVAGVFVAHEEGRLDAAAVGVDARLASPELVGVAKDLLVVVEDELVDGAAERQEHHLRHLIGLKAARNCCAVGRAEAVGQLAFAVASRQRILSILSGFILFHFLLVADWSAGER